MNYGTYVENLRKQDGVSQAISNENGTSKGPAVLHPFSTHFTKTMLSLLF